MPCAILTLAGFDYPLSVTGFSEFQALFHAQNAHRVHLSEPFTWYRAGFLSSPLLPCFLSPNSNQNPEGQTRSPGISFEALFPATSSTAEEFVKF